VAEGIEVADRLEGISLWEDLDSVLLGEGEGDFEGTVVGGGMEAEGGGLPLAGQVRGGPAVASPCRLHGKTVLR
jgi:hypothetical protein